ncbi:MAG: hypothetical protein RIQ56_1024 [Candidatus Parcubacteria bacterium]|jgi:hypothetical protein
MIVTRTVGFATNVIDTAYVCKRSLCVAVDQAMGVRESDLHSLARLLDVCYQIRRPGFVACDVFLEQWLSVWRIRDD